MDQIIILKELRRELENLQTKNSGVDFSNAFVLLSDLEQNDSLQKSGCVFEDIEHSLRYILDRIPFRLIWKDLSLNVKGYNQFYEELLEKNQDEKIMQDAICKEGNKYDKEITDGKRKTGIFRFVYENKYKEKQVFRVEKIALYNPQKILVGILETQIDITYQHRLKDKIFEVNRLLYSVLNTIPYAVFWKDKDFRFKYVNDRFLAIVGYKSINEIVGKTDFELFRLDQSDGYRHDDLDIMNTKRPILDIIEFLTKTDGSKIWLKTNKAPVLNEKGNFQGIIGVFEDITESYDTRIALRHSEARLKSYFDCSTDGIIVLDQNLEIKEVNMAMESIFAHDHDFFIGRNLFDLFVDNDMLLDLKAKYLQMDIDSVSGQCSYMNSCNDLKYLKVDLIYIEVDHYICLVRDITELLGAIKKAEESNRLKTAFLQNISHEIRTPLNAIIGFSNLLLLKMYETENEADEFKHIIYNNSEYLLGLVNSVIDLSKIETDQTNLTIQCINLFPFLQEEIFPVIISERDRLEKMDVEVNLMFDNQDFDLQMDVDSYRLKQIIVNLMHNALKFTEKGSVVLKVHRNEDMVCFVVVDTGIGIKKDQLDKIFHRFYKINDSRLVSMGSGLGLAIVKKLLHIMGGSIQVESELEKGTKFSFSLPQKFQ